MNNFSDSNVCYIPVFKSFLGMEESLSLWPTALRETQETVQNSVCIFAFYGPSLESSRSFLGLLYV